MFLFILNREDRRIRRCVLQVPNHHEAIRAVDLYEAHVRI